MMSWHAILAGIILALVGIRKSFFPMWSILCNILISIYMGIMLTPMIIEIIPGAGWFNYRCGVSTAGVAIVTFVILQIFASNFITGKFKVSFPKIIDEAGAGILGFIAGYLACSFILFAICITPLSRQPFLRKICTDNAPVIKSPIVRTCDFVATASRQHRSGTVESVVDWLIEPGYELKYEPTTNRKTKN